MPAHIMRRGCGEELPCHAIRCAPSSEAMACRTLEPPVLEVEMFLEARTLRYQHDVWQRSLLRMYER